MGVVSAARRSGAIGARATKAILERENDMVSDLRRFRRSEARIYSLEFVIAVRFGESGVARLLRHASHKMAGANDNSWFLCGGTPSH